MSFPKVPEPHDTPRTIVPSGFALPSSSADFNLFSKSNRSSRRRASYSPPRSETGLSNSLSQSELTRLRSSAFWELHQSITENGEGFVQRMRDYEHVRSRQSPEPTRRGRKRDFHPQTTPHTYIADSDESGDDEDEDIQIFSGDLSANPGSCSPRHGEQSTSMVIPYYPLRNGDQEYDQEYNQFFHQNQPPSSMMFGSNPLPVISDSHLSPSTLSFSSTNPSLLSSPIQSQHFDSDISPSSLSLPSSLSPSDSASSLGRTPSLSSDKAISEITLALANGAGAIRDYSHIQNLTSFEHMDAGESGELWH